MRVIGLPGEMVEVRDGGVVVDGLLLSPPAQLSGVRYAAATDSKPPPRMAYPFQVPGDSYFVLGDNAAHAFDSRFWGALPRENILGWVRDK
jgi:signal peptidase I